MSDKTNLFEVASRKKFRFPSQVGELSYEHLWDIPLEGKNSLNSIAVAIHEEIEKSGKINFVTAASPRNTELTQKLDLIKHIIAVRLEEQNAAKVRAERASKRRLLDQAIAAKEHEQLLGGDLEDLLKRRAELED